MSGYLARIVARHVAPLPGSVMPRTPGWFEPVPPAVDGTWSAVPESISPDAGSRPREERESPAVPSARRQHPAGRSASMPPPEESPPAPIAQPASSGHPDVVSLAADHRGMTGPGQGERRGAAAVEIAAHDAATVSPPPAPPPAPTRQPLGQAIPPLRSRSPAGAHRAPGRGQVDPAPEAPHAFRDPAPMRSEAARPRPPREDPPVWERTAWPALAGVAGRATRAPGRTPDAPTPAAAPAAAELAGDGPHTVEVSIGRIEVRAAPAGKSVTGQERRPATMTLEEYLRRRNGGARR